MMQPKRKSIMTFWTIICTCLLIGAGFIACGGDKVTKQTPQILQGEAESTPIPNGPRTRVTIAWSIYTGWMPWPLAEKLGILKKWGDKYNVDIELKKMDYMPSIEAYAAGNVDGVTITNMDVLIGPAVSGVDSTICIVGDYSNGNDKGIVRDNLDFNGLKGKSVYLVEGSVSHYLLSRILEQKGLNEKDVRIVNVSDSDIASGFIAKNSQKVVVTWNPMAMQVAQVPGMKVLFSSAEIPGEILDVLAVKTELLKAHPEVGNALAGAWYETIRLMPNNNTAQTYMAKESGANLVEFKGQMQTTAMFYRAQEAVTYTKKPGLKTTMEFVRKFSFEHGLLGKDAKSANFVGIEYPDGSIRGDPNNVRIRFDTAFMEGAQ